ncbi:hypothetical protein TcasGA2_TC004492 [Tribolium castaneum]|uniref:Uncharacterized protein n=1 Tax=Tribolium castaneum TaxID=7070 RepID=D6WCF7_TRICA|nr:hypothetical protein TcasGA2_TC004492 [Tribolium castaneum]
MSCNFKKCVFVPRSSFTSALFKVLVTLKLLHGSRTGAKGSTLEDIAMYMIKHFCLDGDIKSQVLASLKYGVKMHFIQKKKEKFSLILPASSIHLAPCRFKNEEMERIHCLFPAKWQSNACNDVCANEASCCGKRRRQVPRPCCQDSDEEDAEGGTCFTCPMKKRPKSMCAQNTCSKPPAPSNSCATCHTTPQKNKSMAPCPKALPPACRRRGRPTRSKSLYDDYCQMCGDSESDDACDTCSPAYSYKAYKNCSCFCSIMAPYPSYKKHVKFAKSRSPVARKKVPNTADSYANIVLYYLSKLKGLFHSPVNHEKTSYYARDAYDSSKPILRKDSRKMGYGDSDIDAKEKACEIVNAAIQYGCANNIIEKVGNYFLLKKSEQPKQRMAVRRPTPGPDYVRCASCKNLTKFSRKYSVVNVRENRHKSKRHRGYYDDYGHTSPVRRKRSASNTSTINYCSKCYARMRSSRR